MKSFKDLLDSNLCSVLLINEDIYNELGNLPFIYEKEVWILV